MAVPPLTVDVGHVDPNAASGVLVPGGRFVPNSRLVLTDALQPGAVVPVPAHLLVVSPHLQGVQIADDAGGGIPGVTRVEAPVLGQWVTYFHLTVAAGAGVTFSLNGQPLAGGLVIPWVGPHPYVSDGGKTKRVKQLFVVDGGRTKRVKQLFVVDGGKTKRVR